jgi:hypothetical protein
MGLMRVHALGELEPCIELSEWVVKQFGATQALFLEFGT